MKSVFNDDCMHDQDLTRIHAKTSRYDRHGVQTVLVLHTQTHTHTYIPHSFSMCAICLRSQYITVTSKVCCYFYDNLTVEAA